MGPKAPIYRYLDSLWSDHSESIEYITDLLPHPDPYIAISFEAIIIATLFDEISELSYVNLHPLYMGSPPNSNVPRISTLRNFIAQ